MWPTWILDIKNMKHKKVFAWLYVIIWCGVIFFFSNIPDLKIKELGFWDFVLRKIAHMTEYLILTILLIRAFVISYNKYKKELLIFSIILAIFYAFTDEVHQKFVPGRHFAITDILIDFFGSILGVLVWNNFYIKKFKNYLKN